MEKKREYFLDAAKTIAIFIVLLNHADIHLLGINFWGGMFFVPAFFVLAGYTYTLRTDGFLTFAKKKAKRLLLPYFYANLFYLAFFTIKEVFVNKKLITVNVKSLIGIFYARNQLYAESNEANIYFMPLNNAPTWFLPALFLSLLLFDALMRAFQKNQKKIAITLIALFFIESIYRHFCQILLPFSIDMTAYFALLIQTGYLMKEHDILKSLTKKNSHVTDKRRKKGVLILTIAYIFTALYNGSVNLSIAQMGRNEILALYNSAMASFILILLCYLAEYGFKRSYLPKLLSIPGKHTMTILCYHLFVFMFVGTAINIAANLIGMGENVIVLTILRLLMVIATIAFFSWVKEEREKKERKNGNKR